MRVKLRPDRFVVRILADTAWKHAECVVSLQSFGFSDTQHVECVTISLSHAFCLAA